MKHSSQKQARAIEQIVRAHLLLMTPILCGVGALLLQQRGNLAFCGLAVVGLCLAGIARLLAKVPARELMRLAQGGVLALAVITLLAVGLGPRLGFYRTLTVLSGSMRPTFNPGDMIVVRPEPARDLRVGQVIAYTIPVDGRQLETHRVIRILAGGHDPLVQTQGDANNWRDPWTAKLHGGTVWRLGVVVPYVGYGVKFLRSPLMHRAAIFVAPGLIALIVLAEIWGFSPRRRKPTSLGDVPAMTTGLSTQPR